MDAAVVIDDARCKIIKHLATPDLLRAQQGHSLRQLPRRYLQKHLIIGTCKCQIDIIIPRDKSLMTHCAQKCPRIQHIGNLVFPADPVYLLQKAQIRPVNLLKPRIRRQFDRPAAL